MKTKSNILRFCIFAVVIFYTSCKEKEKYPVIPFIENPSLTKTPGASGIDEKGILKFSFTDGDGDIGLAESDTLPPFNPESIFYYDLFIIYYEKQHGQYVPVVLPMTYNSRIPVLTPNGENKSIKGDIEVELFINNYVSNYDTIAFDVSIADRALNVSNTIRTPDIIVKKH
ncbi:MAG: hypothetical protein WC599_06355 [Bacteroidales bacterium]